MPRPAKNDRNKPKSQAKPNPVVQDQSLQRKLAERLPVATISNVPVRTLLKIEVTEIPPGSLQSIVKTALQSHQSAHPNHPVYICPVRNGVVQSEPLFEGAILDLVKDLCEVVDGEIVFKGRPPVEVDVKSFKLH